jgi:hypothetical protein
MLDIADVAGTSTGGARTETQLMVRGSTAAYIHLVAQDNSKYDAGITFGSINGGFASGIISDHVYNALAFRAGGDVGRMYLNSSGNLGIGTSIPEARLHIWKGNAGVVTANSNASIVAEDSTNSYIQVLAPDASEKGMLFGSPATAGISGAVIVNSLSDMQFRTGGNNTNMTLKAGGRLGIGTTTPGDSTTTTGTKLEVAGGDAQIRVKNTADALGAFIGNTYLSVQLGLYNPTGATASSIAAGGTRSLLGMEMTATGAKVGSLTSNFGSPTYRNLLDDGTGIARFPVGVQVNLWGAAAPGSNPYAVCGGVNGASVTDVYNYLYDCPNSAVGDYAEVYPVVSGISYGDVLTQTATTVTSTLGNTVPRLDKSTGTYQQVLGVSSDNHGDFSSTGYEWTNTETTTPVALNGRVPVKVSAENGSINPGDPIATSSIPGVGMKATQPGYILGYAIGSFTGPGQGTVMVFVGNQYYVGGALTAFGTGTKLVSDLVGVGISAPTAQLHVRGTLSTALTGTVDVTNASATVTGTGTLFTTELKVGDAIKLGVETFTITAINSDTDLTLDTAYQGTTATTLVGYHDNQLFLVENGAGSAKLSVDRSGNMDIGGNLTMSKSGSTIDLASGTAGNTVITKVPRLASGTCGSGNVEGWVFQTDGGVQIGHACVEAAGTDQMNWYAESFNGTGTDVAESYNASPNQTIEKGDVVALDPTAAEGFTVVKADKNNADMVMGIISTRPGVTLSGVSEDGKRTDNARPVMVALAGRVPTKVSDENGAIATGDLLTPSSTAGVAMKRTDYGPIIGRALAPLASGTGKIEVFVRLEQGVASNVASGQSVTHSANLDVYGTLNMNSGFISNVTSITSSKWAITADGRFESTVTDAATGTSAKITAVSSPQVAVALFGQSQVANGVATVKWADVDPAFSIVADFNAPVSIVLTPRNDASLRITDQNGQGFTVAATGTDAAFAQFNFVVYAYRKGHAAGAAPAPAPAAPATSTVPTTPAESTVPTDPAASTVPTTPADPVPQDPTPAPAPAPAPAPVVDPTPVPAPAPVLDPTPAPAPDPTPAPAPAPDPVPFVAPVTTP